MNVSDIWGEKHEKACRDTTVKNVLISGFINALK
ncbi:hypothetical protein BXY41_11229 [Lacrimispora xylanisolvens]|uniref:Uncharacterized protein n=1 Tax=Lacrimispora xylanisolvens TaxID=384636 RepID=A0A2S6HN20_9FIRM|nr:hypothetical protein BXY41_11229 [Hungatella xylanolytica]